jgi:hypothetical protein
MLVGSMSCAFAQPLKDGKPKLLREGWGFACELTAEQGDFDRKNAISADAVCGQVGPLWLGMSRAEAESVLGKPTDQKIVGEGTFYVYSLRSDASAGMTAYAVLSYNTQGRAATIQITGEKWPAAWTFADIKLGDTDEAVVARLGEPHNKSPSELPSTVLWDYLPWTFSFEITDHHVSSIRVAE